MAIHLTKNNIDKLTSKIKYSKFEDGQGGCDDIPFYSSIWDELQRYPMYDLHRISDKILKAICFIYNKKRYLPDDFDEELCWYFYYWLGDKIYPKVKHQTVFSYIIQMIYTELSLNSENFIFCKRPNTNINLDIFFKNKMLFDYSKDYHNFELATPHGETTCDKEYKEHMNNYISIKRNRPENFEEELCSYLYYWLGDIIYPKVKSQAVFSYIIKMIYTELYSNIRDDFIVCKNVYTPIDQDRFNKNKVLFDYSKDYHNIEIATPHGETTCDKDYRQYMENYISTCRLSENGRAVLDNQKAHEEQEPVTDQSYRHTSITPPPYQIAEQEADLVMNQHKRGETFPTAFELSKMDDTPEGGSSKTIAGSIAPVLGVSSISLLLYKLTPVGGYINRLLGRNRNMYNHIEYMDSFNPYSDGMVPGDRRMNISYHRS
ncbi:PIR protein [Plasmodium vivax]|uniref:VIR protein n=1 Tax=Plasmodium vivax TaxID=5855 RepID=A0A565A761_PLAVI|nr:PIR protein [Plasmodium vivax]